MTPTDHAASLFRRILAANDGTDAEVTAVLKDVATATRRGDIETIVTLVASLAGSIGDLYDLLELPDGVRCASIAHRADVIEQARPATW